MIKNIVIDFDNTIANSSETALAYISDKYKTFDFNTSYDPSVLLWGFQPFITDKDLSISLEIIGKYLGAFSIPFLSIISKYPLHTAIGFFNS